MSYPQFGYSYPSSTQLLMTGNHPATATPCCQPASPVEPYAGGGAPQPTPGAAAVCSLPAAYDSRLLSSFPRLAGLYASSATAYGDPQGYVSAALASTNHSTAFYSSLTSPYDLKESSGAWTPLSQTTATSCYPYDPGVVAYGPYGDRYSSMDSVARRKNATRETTNTLKAWLYEHRKNPYPTKGEKIMLAVITKMTLTQVSTWFANARRRLKKENKMTWEPRNKGGEAGDTDDKEDQGSSPSLSNSDHGGKKSNDDSLHDCDDSGDLRVKREIPSKATENHAVSTEYSSCAIKSESTGRGQSGQCQSVTMGHYPNRPDFRPPSPMGGHHLQFPGSYPHPHRPNSPKIWSLAHTATSDSPPKILPPEPNGVTRPDCAQEAGDDKGQCGYPLRRFPDGYQPPMFDSCLSPAFKPGESATFAGGCGELASASSSNSPSPPRHRTVVSSCEYLNRKTTYCEEDRNRNSVRTLRDYEPCELQGKDLHHGKGGIISTDTMESNAQAFVPRIR